RCDHGDLLLHLPRCRSVLCPDRVRHRGTRWLRQRVRGVRGRYHRWSRGGDNRDDHAAGAQIGRDLRGLSWRCFPAPARPVWIDLMPTDFPERRRRLLFVAAAIVVVVAALPLFVRDVYVQNILVLTLMYAALSQSWNILSGYCGQISLGHALYFGLGA